MILPYLALDVLIGLKARRQAVFRLRHGLGTERPSIPQSSLHPQRPAGPPQLPQRGPDTPLSVGPKPESEGPLFHACFRTLLSLGLLIALYACAPSAIASLEAPLIVASCLSGTDCSRGRFESDWSQLSCDLLPDTFFPCNDHPPGASGSAGKLPVPRWIKPPVSGTHVGCSLTFSRAEKTIEARS